MKKLTLFASAIVAVLAVSSCSNDELEPIVEKKGTPLSITVSSIGDTRGANVVTSGLKYLNLTAKQGTTTWANDVLFSKSGDVWSGEANWPTEDKTTPSNFYVISENATGTKSYSANVTEYLTSGTTFNYTVPNPEFTGSGATMKETAQPDLLVATASQAEGDGPLALDLKHALANIKIMAVFPSGNLPSGTQTWSFLIQEDEAFYRIKKLSICNVYTSGTFDYSNIGTETNPWTTSGALSNIEIEFPTAIDIPVTQVAQNAAANYLSDKYTTLVPENANIRVIPQSITSWGANHSNEVALNKATNAYIKLSAFCAKGPLTGEYDEDLEEQTVTTGFYFNNTNYYTDGTLEQAYDDLYTDIYIPLKLKDNKFSFNTNHTFKINLFLSSYFDDGVFAFEGFQIQD